MDNDNSLYRKQALEKFAQDATFNQRLQIVPRRGWILLCVLILCTAALLLWSIFGVISVRVRGEGILLAESGGVYSAISPEVASRLVSIAVKPGELIEKGTIIAEMSLPDLQQKLNVAQDYLQKLRIKQLVLTNSAAIAIKENHANLEKQKASLQRSINNEAKNLKNIEELLAVKQDLFKKGITTRDNLMATSQQVYSSKREIENLNNRLDQMQISHQEFKQNWQHKIRELELQIVQQQNNVNNLVAQSNISRYVKSPVNGIVLDLQATIGDQLAPGTPVASIAAGSRTIDAILYVNAKDGKLINKKMRALISPTIIKREEFGSMLGQVKATSEYPVTPQHMEALLQNEELVKKFTRDGAPIAIRVKLARDNRTTSGYAWTSYPGPNHVITPGTLITGMITVRQQAPISLVIPTLKKLMGTQQ